MCSFMNCVALSYTEAENMAVAEGLQGDAMDGKASSRLDFEQEGYALTYDNQSAIHLSKNPTFQSQSKHIDMQYNWIHDVLNEKLLQLVKVLTNENGSDMMTKTLPKEKHVFCSG